MARVTVEDCVEKIPNRFDLVLLASHRSRNISVDIRFVLWHLESVMKAPHLLREMGL